MTKKLILIALLTTALVSADPGLNIQTHLAPKPGGDFQAVVRVTNSSNVPARGVRAQVNVEDENGAALESEVRYFELIEGNESQVFVSDLFSPTAGLKFSAKSKANAWFEATP